MADSEIMQKLEDWFMDDGTGVEQFIEEFAKKHKDVFDLTEEEHKLEYTTIYKDFQDQFEAKLEGFLKDNSYTNEQLVDACRAATADSEHHGIDIVGVMLATLEYDVFLQMMADAKERFTD
mmetsp:Transcript_22858/g.35777  ORF Transcript_22858/g.35777 Transcript_22858/m.35777 type:complete len:121 (+) Transcript_22858:109-471(+)